MEKHRINSASSSSSILRNTPKHRWEMALSRQQAGVREKEYWTHTSNYFQSLAQQNDRFNALNSSELRQKSQDAYAKIKHSATDEEAKREERIARRHLEMENRRKEFEEELKLNRKSQRTRAANTKSLYDLRNDYERLQFLRFERQQKEAEEKMLQHWRINNPDYRELQFKKRQEMVQRAWEEQVEEKQEREKVEKIKAEEDRLREEEELKRKAKVAEEEAVQRQRKLDEWKQAIEEQKTKLDMQQKEEAKLKEEMALENQRLKEVDLADQKRKEAESKRCKSELGDFLKRQHRIKMLAKARQVEDELREDQKILEELKSFAKKEEEEQFKKAEEARTKQVEWLDGVLSHQRSEEAKRRQDMDQLFTEEAKRMWEKQEKTWSAEKEARQKLMEDVLKTLSEQTKTKLKEKEKRIDEITLEKEILRENIEKMNTDIINEQKKQIEKKEMFVEDLDAQIEEKDRLSTKQNEDQKKTEKLRVEMLWDQRVRDKNELANRLSKWSFDPSDTAVSADFRRRRAKWY